MKNMKLKVFLFSNIYPIYRKSIWDKILENKELNATFYFSPKTIESIATVSVKKVYSKSRQKKFNPITNRFINKKLIWQNGVLKTIFQKVDTVIFLGEMTVLSTWIAAIIFKLRGVRVLFWGHGLYGSENCLKRFFRLKFLQIADHNLVYGKRAKKLLIQRGFNKSEISVIYNSINYDEQKEFFNKYQIKSPTKIFNNLFPTLLFVGRLYPQKKVDQIIKAVQLLEKDNNKFNLLVVGEGPEKERLELLAQPLINNGQCIFYGASYNEAELSKLIYTSDLTVSPGNVGLTGIHSLSYGTPVCSHSNHCHQMPEVESIIEGENGFLFKEGDINSLIEGITLWFKENSTLNRKKIRNIVDKYYNPNYQFKIIKRLVGK